RALLLVEPVFAAVAVLVLEERSAVRRAVEAKAHAVERKTFLRLIPIEHGGSGNVLLHRDASLLADTSLQARLSPHRPRDLDLGQGGGTGVAKSVSVEIRRARLQAGKKIGRALHREALVIEAQAVEPAEFLAIAGAAGTAVVALRHDDAVAGMCGRNRW